jgi:hypothetical protein
MAIEEGVEQGRQFIVGIIQTRGAYAVARTRSEVPGIRSTYRGSDEAEARVET